MGKILSLYKELLAKYGYQNWWPCEGEKYGNEEIAIGAILTQNTSWSNVERALKKLKERNLLTLRSIYNAEEDVVKECIMSAGFYNQKARYLKNFSKYIVEKYGCLKDFFHQNKGKSVDELRRELLGIKGIGKETADSILLYAGFLFIFVVDAYTFRLFEERGIIRKGRRNYEEVRQLVERELTSVEDLQEFHALIVREMKERRKNRKKDI